MRDQVLTVGKQVAGNRYYHIDALAELSAADQCRVADADEIAGCSTWNVVKLKASGEVSLLTYEAFERPFPALLESVTVALNERVTRRSYRAHRNPPVLHRKELLLPRADPRRPRFAALTAQLSALGLLRAAQTIGTRQGWEARLRAAGVEVVDHEIRMQADDPPVRIYRHRAAIGRDGLSAPIQALIRHGLVSEATSVFDYGCGLGSDVEGLRQLGLEANGWDPHFAPHEERRPAQVVNLGFVLNVIERPAERLEALREAFALAEACLSVAVITSSSARIEASRPFADGVVTRRGTFQKFFAQTELKALIEATLGREAHPAGERIFFVFKDPLVEQSFLVRRQERRLAATELRLKTRSRSAAATAEALRPELEAILREAEQLGRWPAEDEAPEALVQAVTERAGAWRRAIKFAHEALDLTSLETARVRRREDLGVYFALNLFNGRGSYGSLPGSLQRDVKAHFGSYANALASGRELLQQLAVEGALPQAVERASLSGLGIAEPEEGYWLCAGLIPRLPPLLRVLVGCAERYNGGLDGAQVVKIHESGHKVTLLRYSDFDVSPIPRLRSRVKINLARQTMRLFDHWGEDQRLLFKSDLMAADQEGYAAQAAFDDKLRARGLSSLGRRATLQELTAALRPATRANVRTGDR